MSVTTTAENVVDNTATAVSSETLLSQKPYMKKAIEVLAALDIILLNPDGTFDFEDNATRAELVVNTLRMMNITESFTVEEQIFSDVEDNHWAYNEINAAYNMKIINGYKDGYFRPDDGVTLNEAIKMLVTMLGYSSIAEAKGGYPDGYKAIAYDKKIINGIDSRDANIPISRGTMAVLLYNMLETEIAEPVSFGKETELEVNSNTTVISQYRDIYKGEGLVTANTVSALNNPDRNTEYIAITLDEEKEYKPGKTDANNLLGYYVEFYYEHESSTDIETLLYIDVVEAKNEVIELTADQICSDTTNSTLKYYKDAQTQSNVQSATIYEGANVIYNGVYAGYKAHALDSSLLKPKSGVIKLFDTDRDNRYDIVSITDYVTYYVDYVSLTEMKIYDKYLSKPIELDEVDNYEIVKNGSKVLINEIKSDDILAVAVGDNYVKIIIVDIQPLTGSVSAIYDDKFEIAGQELEISKSYNISGEHYSFDPRRINLGDEGTVYFDIDNKIAAFISNVDLQKYAYILEAGTDRTISKSLQIRTLEADGSFITHTLAKRVKLDGEKKENADEIHSYLKRSGMSGTGEAGNGVYQPIIYKLNAKGEISYIDTTIVGQSENIRETLTLDIDDRLSSKEHLVANAAYFTTPKLFVPRYNTELPNNIEGGSSTSFTVSDSTVVFSIPADENAAVNLDAEDEENFVAKKISGLSQKDYTVSAYSLDVSSNNCAKVVVIKDTSGGVVDPRGATTAVVAEKRMALDSNGNYVAQLTLLQSGSTVKVLCKDNAVVRIFNNGSRTTAQTNAMMTTDYINVGHTIMYSQEASGMVSNISVMYPAKNIDPTAANFGQIDKNEAGWVWGLTDTYCKAYGQVLRKSGNTIKLKTENICDYNNRSSAFPMLYNFYELSSAKIYIVDVKNKTVSLGNIDDIVGAEQGDQNCYALCTIRSTTVETAVIYKF